MGSVKKRSQNLNPKHFEPRVEPDHGPESEKDKEKSNSASKHQILTSRSLQLSPPWPSSTMKFPCLSMRTDTWAPLVGLKTKTVQLHRLPERQEARSRVTQSTGTECGCGSCICKSPSVPFPSPVLFPKLQKFPETNNHGHRNKKNSALGRELVIAVTRLCLLYGPSTETIIPWLSLRQLHFKLIRVRHCNEEKSTAMKK